MAGVRRGCLTGSPIIFGRGDKNCPSMGIVYRFVGNPSEKIISLKQQRLCVSIQNVQV